MVSVYIVRQIRRVIRLFRRVIHKILGTRYVFQPAAGGHLPFVVVRDEFDQLQDNVLRLSDRLAINESILNWRLFGMPARICNVKLEQARLVAGALDVEQALASFAEGDPRPQDCWRTLPLSSGAHPALAFATNESESVAMKQAWDSKVSRWTWIHDVSDLFLQDTFDATEGDVVLELSPTDVAARLGEPEFGVLWLGDVLERVTPLQARVLLHRARQALLPNGICAGYFLDFTQADPGRYWLDPRRLRPLTSEGIKQLAHLSGLTTVKLEPLETFPGWYRYILSGSLH